MTARLAAGVLVSAMMRRVQAEGGNAVVLARGDRDAGAILILCLERGAFRQLIERTLDPQGRYAWTQVGPVVADGPERLSEYLERRRRADPDLWLVELDIASAERFAAEATGDG